MVRNEGGNRGLQGSSRRSAALNVSGNAELLKRQIGKSPLFEAALFFEPHP